MPQGGARGQHLEHFRIYIYIYIYIFSFMDSCVFKQQVLFRVDFLSVTLDHRVQCPRVGLGVKIQDILKIIFFLLLFFCFVINRI